MDYKDLYRLYLWAYGLKKAGDVDAASNLVGHAHGKGAPEQFAVALGLRDANDDEYTTGGAEGDDDETPSESIYNFSGFKAAIDMAFDEFDTN